MAQNPGNTPLHKGLPPAAVRLIEDGRNYHVYQQRPPLSHLFVVVGAAANPAPYEAAGFERIGDDLSALVEQLKPAPPRAPPEEQPARSAQSIPAAPKRLVLYVHGYNNDSPTVARTTCHYPRQFQVDPEREVWVTYDWPGERGWVSPGTWRAALATGWEVAGSLLFLLPVLLVLAGLVALFGALAAHSMSLPTVGPGWLRWLHGRGFPGDVSAFLALISVLLGLIVVLLGLSLLGALPFLRLSSYPRDLYMAMHRGVPDLCEFFRHLDYYYSHQHPEDWEKEGEPPPEPENDRPCLREERRIGVDIIAHSMGCLLTLNVVRILSDLFIAPGPQQRVSPHLGRSLRVGTLVLVAADVPVELLQVSQDNYFASALRRFEGMYVFSNPYDAILHLLSYAINSFAEPQPGLGRSRLGNVFFPPPPAHPPETSNLSERPWAHAEKVFANELSGLRPRLDLIEERVSFLDCSERPTLSAPWVRRLNPFPPLRDFFILALYATNRVDCHAGYFTDLLIWDRIRQAIRGELGRGKTQNEVLPSE